jgi:RNA polymerase sigma-70 factor (ECF subfamily)
MDLGEAAMGFEMIEWAIGEPRSLQDIACGSTSTVVPGVDWETTKWHSIIMDLYDTAHTSLYKYLINLSLSPDEAEDVIQEVFLRLANHLKGGGNDRNLRSWVFRVAYNCSMDIHRSNGRNYSGVSRDEEDMEEISDPGKDPELIYLQKERMKRVSDAMSQLTPKQRNSVFLRSEGLRYMEIGSVLGVSESRAIYLVKRGLQQLMRYL